jgi:hypothetical protein
MGGFMSKPAEQASTSVTTPGRVSSLIQKPQPAAKQQGRKDDVSWTHLGIAVGGFAAMIGLFGYGFYIQQTTLKKKRRFK